MLNFIYRYVTIDWLYKLALKFNLSRQILHTTIIIADIYCQKNDIGISDIRLVVISAFNIATKYYSIYELDIKDMITYSHNIYNCQQIENMTTNILKSLNYRIVYPTVHENLIRSNASPFHLYLSDIIMTNPIYLFIDITLLTTAILNFPTDDDYGILIYLLIKKFKLKKLNNMCLYNNNIELDIPIIKTTSNLDELCNKLKCDNISVGFNGIDITKCKMISKLGEGTYGTVFETSLNDKSYALKKMYSIENSDISFYCEITAYIILDHPNLLKCYGIYYNNNCKYLLLELMDKCLYDLKYVHDKNKYNYIIQLLRGIQYMHSKDMMHRDLKPNNILIKSNVLKIGDFGTAIHYIPGFEYESSIGTRHYASIEMLSGYTKYNQKVDHWSIGCIIYFLFERKELFYGDPLNEIYKIFEVPASVPTWFDRSKYTIIRPTTGLKSSRYAKEMKCVEQMMSTDPACRPDISEMIKCFENNQLLSHNA